jgi:hypothetical protein
MMSNIPPGSIFVFRTNASQIHKLGIPDSGHSDRLRENAFGPVAMIEFFDLDRAILGMGWNRQDR